MPEEEQERRPRRGDRESPVPTVLEIRSLTVRSLKQTRGGLRARLPFAGARGCLSMDILRGVNLRLGEGEVVLLLGPSGSGKSLLGRILAGLEGPWSPSLGFGEGASIKIHLRAGQSCELIADHYPEELRRRVGYMFQSHALFDALSVAENIALGRDQARRRWERAEFAAWYEEITRRLGISQFEKRPLDTLSIGQRQRVSLVRTLAMRPEVLLYDEPTSGLDPHSAEEVARLIREAARDPAARPRLSLVVTHDYVNLLPIAERIVLINRHFSMSDHAIGGERERERARAAAREEMESYRVTQGEAMSPRAFALQRDAARMRRLRRALHAGASAAASLARHLGRNQRWHLRFGGRLLMDLGISAAPFLAVGGFVLGLVLSYFTVNTDFGGLEGFVEPVVLDSMVEGLGVVFFAVVCPLFSAILLASRSGAAASGYLANMRRGSELDALEVLGLSPGLLLGVPLVAIFTLALVALNFLAWTCGALASMAVILLSKPMMTYHTWEEAYFRQLGTFPFHGFHWLLWKLVPAAILCAAIAYLFGTRAMREAAEVNRAITRTIIWSILAILVVFFAVLYIEVGA